MKKIIDKIVKIVGFNHYVTINKEYARHKGHSIELYYEVYIEDISNHTERFNTLAEMEQYLCNLLPDYTVINKLKSIKTKD